MGWDYLTINQLIVSLSQSFITPDYAFPYIGKTGGAEVTDSPLDTASALPLLQPNTEQ